MTGARRTLLLLTALISLVFMPQAAQAAFSPLACDGSGNVVPGTQLYYADAGANEGACASTGIQHILGTVLCNFVLILDSVLGKLYCGVQFSMTNILALIFTVYIAVFGAQLLMGATRLNIKEFVTRLVKIAIVWVFATESAYGINLAFTFFMGVINDGSAWVISTILPAAGETNAQSTPIFDYIDQLVYQAITGPFVSANEKVLSFFVVMMPFFPPLGLAALYWLLETFTMLVRTLINFMLSVSVIALLISLSPIFMSFMLFQSTFHFFETWLRYMTSYSLQIVIVFAAITLWISTMQFYVDFFNDLSDMIFPYQQVWIVSEMFNPSDNWAICPPNYGWDPYGPTAACPAGFDPINNPDDEIALIPPSRLLEEQDFLKYVFYHMGTLIVIAFGFNSLLKNSHEIARELGGPVQAPPLDSRFGEGTLGVVRHMFGDVDPSVGSGPTRLGGGRNAVGSFIENSRRLLGLRGSRSP